MFIKSEADEKGEKTTKFGSVMKLAAQFMKKKVINNDRDQVSFVFFPTVIPCQC